MENVEKLIETGLAEVKSKVAEATEKSTAEVQEIKGEIKTVSVQVTEVKEYAEKLQDHVDSLEGQIKSSKIHSEEKSFNDMLSETLTENEEQIKSLARGGKVDFKLDMKAAGDMSYAANFANGSAVQATTEYRQGILMQPDKTKYLREIIPGGRTNAASIWYPKHTGGEGAPAPWNAAAGEKPIFDFDFDAATSPVEWIAGLVRVPRQMLDDVTWLESFLRANMLKALYKAENNQILNGTGVSPQLLGLMPQAEAYDGSYTVFVEQLVDAAAQVNDNEHDANYILLNNRDAVKIALNKASGSGEYDLPPGTIGYVNGQLSIAGLRVVTLPTSQLAAGEFLVGDFNAAQLVTRLNPEIRFFEQDKDNVAKNMITIRIEERVALATFFQNAFVKKATV